MDVVTLSRIQFALTTAFHYIFPPVSIGLGVILVIMEGMYLKTKNPLYEQMTQFWVKIFGLIFAIGVASGIVLEFQFGTNWATYSRYVGDIFGSVLAAEGIFAFFLESSFLAILLFGWNKVGPRMHFFATVMVCLGAILSAFWIVVANSWMQTPAGYITPIGTRVEIRDFWAMVFNPSSLPRITHVLCGAFQAGSFFVLSVSAYYLLKKRHQDFARASFRIALAVAIFGSFMQLPTGHWSAVVVAKYQPPKMAAMEGLYETQCFAPLYLFGWVVEKEERVDFGLAIPGMLSFLIHGDQAKPVPGLREFKPEDRPEHVNWIFQSHHLMVAIGMFLIGLSCVGLFFWWRGTLESKRWLLWIFVFSVLAPQIANQLGWLVAELGRQPWLVYNLLRTSEGISKSIQASQVWTSLILFCVIYILVFTLFLLLILQKIQKGPIGEIVSGGQEKA